MPQIPIQQTGISTDVGGADLNTGAQGLIGSALARTGSQVSNAAWNTMELMTRAEATEAVNSKMSDLTIKSALKKKELEYTSIGGYLVDQDGQRIKNPDGQTDRTITQEFRDWANNEFETSQRSMPNRLGQDMFKQSGLNMFTNDIEHVYSTELAKKAAYFEDQTKLRTKNESHALMSMPELDSLYKFLDKFSQDVQDSANNKVIPQSAVLSNIKEGAEARTLGWAEGNLNLIKEGSVPKFISGTYETGFHRVAKGQLGAVEDMLDILIPDNEKKEFWASLGETWTPRDYNKNPNMFDMYDSIKRRKESGMMTPAETLSPAARDKVIDELLAYRAHFNKQQKSDFDLKIKDATKSIDNGKPLSSESFAALLAEGKRLVQLGPDNGGKFAQEVVNDIASLKVYEKVRARVPLINIDASPFRGQSTAVQKRIMEKDGAEIDSFVSALAKELNDGSMDASIVGQSVKSQYISAISQEISKSAGDYATKGSTFLVENDPSIRKFFDRLDIKKPETFKSMGPELQRHLAKLEARIERDFKGTGQRTAAKLIPNYNEFEDQLAAQIKDPRQGIDAGMKYMDAVKSLYGPYQQRALEQAVEGKKLPEQFMLVAYANSKINQRDALDLAWTGAKINQDFAAQFPDAKVQVDLKTEVANQTQEKLMLRFRNDPDDEARRAKIRLIQEGIEFKAKKHMLNGMSVGDAAKSAADQFVGDLNVRKVGPGYIFGKQKVMYPSLLNDGSTLPEFQQELLDGWASRKMKLEEIKKTQWVTPGEMGAVTPEKFVEFIASEGRPQFGDDPNGGKNPNGTPLQGYYITLPLSRKRNEWTRVKAQEILPNGKTRIFFVPARQAIVEQEAAQTTQTNAMKEVVRKWGPGPNKAR